VPNSVRKTNCSVTLASTNRIILRFSTKLRYYMYEGPVRSSWTHLITSESELCGGAMTVFFSKYLPWKAIQFLLRSTHFSKTCCRPSINSKFLASELPSHVGKAQKSHELNFVFSLEKVFIIKNCFTNVAWYKEFCKELWVYSPWNVSSVGVYLG
jgi:hypothetical protein